jgi:hypothetical protein
MPLFDPVLPKSPAHLPCFPVMRGLNRLPRGQRASQRNGSRSGKGSRNALGPEPRPVVLDLEDTALADEVGLAIAVTGRRMYSSGEVDGGTAGTILVTDRPDNDPGTASGTQVIRVSAEAQDGVWQIPEQIPSLVAAIGRRDLVDISVVGAVGGAGTSILSAALAGVIAESDDRDVALVDADASSWSGHLGILLGLEQQCDRQGVDIPVDITSTDLLADRQRWLASQIWADDVAVLDSDNVPPAAGVSVVRDCGRGTLSDSVEPGTSGDAAEGSAATGQHGAYLYHRVLVAPQTVPGVLVARRWSDADPDLTVVLRELPRSGLTWNQTLSLLGREPTVTWEDDPFITVDIDRGDFRTTGQAAGTAGTAAQRLWEAMNR